jgi:hypothetical protein
MGMSKLLYGLISRDFDDIRGSHISATIPLTERLLNEAASFRTRRTSGRIQQFDIQIGSDNYLQVGMKVTVGPFSKWFRPEVVVHAQAQPAAIVLTLASREYAGLMWLADLFAKELIPKGLSIRGREVTVELAALPVLDEYRDLLRYLKNLNVTTNRGIMAIALEATIN